MHLVCRLLLEKNFFNDTATTEIYTLSLHDALPILTVKMRLGFEAGSETYLLLGQLVQESGAQMKIGRAHV